MPRAKTGAPRALFRRILWAQQPRCKQRVCDGKTVFPWIEMEDAPCYGCSCRYVHRYCLVLGWNLRNISVKRFMASITFW
jgi:hypothetical protein